ncbi:MAG: threonine--tRNA ligase [Candidatus Pacebacteria bacterium]|nr:threonine--tRNA ligase [Candidatus Paceibacterota bacterium]
MNQEEIKRHSLSHILAIAIKEKYPNVKLGIGPAIENGFYYDFDNLNITHEDLKEIEKRMKHLVRQNLAFEKQEISKKEAKEIFENEPYKLELIEEIPDENVFVYKTGDFIDLCAGPHVNSTNEIDPDSFKLDKIAGAYWKGDEKNPMLTRIYGLAFENKVKLKEYLKFLEEAKKRDHRILGKDMDLFHTEEDVGIGLILWHPKGALLFRLIEDFWVKKHLENGYDLVRTPHIGNRRLWEKSGHWGFYQSSMYPPLEIGQSLEESERQEKVEESEQFLLKPMNCPFHVCIYNASPHSYRDFPLKWAETGTVYRFEKKGELSGLTRVRGFTQDDAHIICRKDQVEDELKRVIDFILFIYKSFGFNVDSVKVYLSLRDPLKKEDYAGTDEGWDFAESILRKVAQEKNLNFVEEKGEAAFYGPKLDFKIKDVLGREWQCSTLQFDFNLPHRFGMTFINEKGEKEEPYMLHRALFGSFERFIGLLIEHYAGNFPFWLSPIQASIIPVSEKHREYAHKVKEELREFRVEVKDENETVSKKIREAATQKIPYIITVGDKEVENNTISLRKRGNEDLGEMSVSEFINLEKNNK